MVTLPLLVLAMPIMAICELYRKSSTPIANIATSILGAIYAAFPMSLMLIIPLLLGNGVWNPWIVIFYVFIIWANDVFAYLFGITLGKHRLFERISPKKSWEGFWGGLVLSACVAYVASLYLDILNTWQWIGLALTCSIFGTWGDLCESLIKRSLDVKDSGKSLPGHGGWLDRFDSVLLAVPASILYLFIAMAIA